jgi:adenosylcobinamide-GDP ribazoletransferase
MALLAVAAASRTAMVWHWSLLPPARQGGVAASVGEPESGATIVALTSGLLLSAALLLPHGSVPSFALALVLAIVAVIAFNRTALRKIGGHTGDTIGATQQLAEMSVLFALALAL